MNLETSKWMAFDESCQSVNAYNRFVYQGGEIDICICALGFFELYINGTLVNQEKFVPVWSQYCNRDGSTLLYPSNDVLSERTYYCRYDIKEYVKIGENTLCVVIGNGWFRQTERNAEGKNHYGDRLLLRYAITEDGETISVADDCLYTDNFIRQNNIYFGELHDYARFDQNAFLAPVTEPKRATEIEFSTRLCLQDCPADAMIRRSPFAFMHTLSDGSRIYKLNENISGYVVLRASENDAEVRYAEGLKEDGSLEYGYTGGEEQIQSDRYVHTLAGELLYPRFSWHGFQYFQVFGDAVVERVEVVHTDLRTIASFSCDNPVCNWIVEAFLRTYLDNCHCGVPSDCPHRERLGYLGDGQLVCESAMLMTDSNAFYRKWIRDILDCQDIESGHVQHTAPFYGGGGGPGGWGAAIVIVPYRHYAFYRDESLLRECFSYQKKWVRSMESFCENGLVVKEYEGGWCLGDWCTPNDVEIPEPFVNTYYYIKALGYLAEIADILKEDKTPFVSLRNEHLSALQNAYYNGETHSYCGGVQGADAFAIDLGLGDERTKNNLIEKYRNKTLDTGIFGTDVVISTLLALEEYQLVFDILSSEEYPSFGYWRKNGRTTLCEMWGMTASNNHPMFGAITRHFFTTFAGIDASGETLRIAPKIVEGLNRVSCSMETRLGKVEFSYQKGKDGIRYFVDCDREYVLEVGDQTFSNTSGKFEIETAKETGE